MAAYLLDCREFLEKLRTDGTAEQSEFARQLLADQDTLDAVQNAADCAQTTKKPGGSDPVAVLEELDGKVADYEAVRGVLVEVGALADDDEETPVADLLRALLS